jgi:hypothetical protein
MKFVDLLRQHGTSNNERAYQGLKPVGSALNKRLPKSSTQAQAQTKSSAPTKQE